MSSEFELRSRIVNLLRSHHQQLAAVEKEEIELCRQLSKRHDQRLKHLKEDFSFVQKALIIRKQNLQMRRFKLRLQNKRIELLLKQAEELKELKSRWQKCKVEIRLKG